MDPLFGNIRVFFETNPSAFILFGIWELVWKGFALWKSAHNNQRYWFVILLLVNTLGILPIVYLKVFQIERPVTKNKKKVIIR